MYIPRIDKSYRNLKRYRQIVAILIKYGFAEAVDRMNLATYLQISRRIFKKSTGKVKRLSFEARVRLIFEELGPAFIKLGQLLSTRSFLLPAELISELSRLQDDVPPIDLEKLRESIELQLGMPIDERFEWFDTTPTASASIAQVHRARTGEGTEVVVKVQRPGVARVIATDLDILSDLARLMEKYIPESRQFDPVGIAGELMQSTRRELDFVNEGRNVEIFARNFKDSEDVYVPAVFWDYTTDKILTIEYIDGIKISEVERLRATGCDLPKLARTSGRFILKQIFEDGFFHADPHPGNLFVLPGGIIAPVDFGMMGRLDVSVMEEVSDLLIGAIQRDADLIIRVLINLGSLNEDRDVRALRADISNFIDRYYAVPIKRINIKSIISDVLEMMRLNQLKLPANLLLLMKTLGTHEDITRKLDDEFEIFTLARPYVRKLIMRRLDFKKLAYEGIKTLRDLYDLLRVGPRELELLLRKIKRGQFAIELQDRGLQNLMLELDRASNRIAFSLIIAALIIGSSLILTLQVGPMLWGYPLFGLLGFLFAGILGVWLVIAIIRSGRF